MPDHDFCSEYSLAADEPLSATATRADVWFCLEYAGAWGRNALKDSEIPLRVKDRLGEAGQSIPNLRVQLIKQYRTNEEDGFTFFVAVTRAADSRLYKFSLSTYEDLLKLDFKQIVGGASQFDQFLSPNPIFLTCTNGKRDKCCARNGIAMYQALFTAVGDLAWQCTHLGGHRFAANVVVLPQGTLYGRATPDRAVAISDTSLIASDLFRGRTCFSEPTQAGEHFLRENFGDFATSSLELHSQDEVGEGEWAITMTLNNMTYLLHLVKVSVGYGTYASCGDEILKDVKTFKLTSMTELTS